MLIGRRFRYTPPWKLTQAGFLFGQGIKGTFIGFSGDEYHNSTFYFMVPLICFFCFWYEKDLNPEVEHIGSFTNGVPDGYVDPDCVWCAYEIGLCHIDQYVVTP